MFKLIALFENFPTASLVASQLQSAGFHPAPVPQSSNIATFGSDLMYRIEVLETEADAAIEFLKENGYERQISKQD